MARRLRGQELASLRMTVGTEIEESKTGGLPPGELRDFAKEHVHKKLKLVSLEPLSAIERDVEMVG
jgi:hypothetical protein